MIKEALNLRIFMGILSYPDKILVFRDLIILSFS